LIQVTDSPRVDHYLSAVLAKVYIMIPTYDEMRWGLGISKSDRFYYTPAGKLQLEMLWSRQAKERGATRERDRRNFAHWGEIEVEVEPTWTEDPDQILLFDNPRVTHNPH